jgi:hypothetical protein
MREILIFVTGFCRQYMMVFFIRTYIEEYHHLGYDAVNMEVICSPECRLKLSGLHGIISQKMILFIITAVKTSNPTELTLVTDEAWFHLCGYVIAQNKEVLSETDF